MDPTPEQNPERRRYRRRNPKKCVRVSCQLGTMGLGPNVANSIFDLSELAIRFVAKSALSAGQEVEINLTEPSLNRPIKRYGKILRCTQLDPTTWCAVAIFDRQLDYAEFQRLL